MGNYLNLYYIRQNLSLFIIMIPSKINLFFFNDAATPEIYPFSPPDALPICQAAQAKAGGREHARDPRPSEPGRCPGPEGSEEHTSELQSPCNLVCRLLL